MSNATEIDIRAMIDRETEAWNRQDVDTLVDIFHPDMAWPWPPDALSHDPIHWVSPMGRYNRERWKKNWQELFDTHILVHNRREIIKITVTPEEDGAYAVVDVDTLWMHRHTGKNFHWKGRSCKVYTLVASEWKLIAHTGLLDYSNCT